MPSFIGYTEHCLEQALRPIEDDGERDHAFLMQGRLETDLREEACANTERLVAIIATNLAAYDRRKLEAARAPLVWLGQPDPVESMEKARDEDPERMAIRELFGHWREHLGLSCGYTANAFHPAGEFKLAEFRDLLLRQAGEGGNVNSRRLGKWLSRIQGKIVDGHRLDVKADNSHGNRFSLNEAGAPSPAYPAPEF